MLTDSEMRGYYWVWREVIFSAGTIDLYKCCTAVRSGRDVLYLYGLCVLDDGNAVADAFFLMDGMVGKKRLILDEPLT
jgi:hypothetical protein